jgi:hypothetical protein
MRDACLHHGGGGSQLQCARKVNNTVAAICHNPPRLPSSSDVGEQIVQGQIVVGEELSVGQIVWVRIVL